MRRVALIVAALMLATPELAACSRLRRGDEPRPQPAEAVDPNATDPAAVNADARRILQTRAFTSLRASVAETERAAVRAAIETQVGAWNRGDLEGFMAGYARDDDVRFVAGSSVSRGWAGALRRYQERYPSPAEMGVLSVSGFDIDILAPDAAVVFARWRLARADAPLEGVFTLVMRKIDGRWLIVHDHTAAAS